MILESIVYRFLRGLAMPEKAAIDIGSIICDAYADLVSGYAPILLAIASPLYIDTPCPKVLSHPACPSVP